MAEHCHPFLMIGRETPWQNTSPIPAPRRWRWASAWRLGCTDPVSSPTFAIVNYYRGPRPLAHFDLYRISTENDLCAAGFYDYLDQGAIVAAEWSENFADLLALEQPIHVNIERVDENTRKITIEGVEV